MLKLNNKKGLTGYQLKIIGIIFMVFDHIHQMFSSLGAPMFLTKMGRIVAPIFLYLSAEGFYYTRDRKKYMFRLWISSVLMNIATLLIERIFPLQNVSLMNSMFSTLFLSVLYMYLIDNFINEIKKRNTKGIILSIIYLIIPVILSIIGILLVNLGGTVFFAYMIFVPSLIFTEGGFIWVLLAVSFYLLRNRNKFIQVLPIIIIFILLFINKDFTQSYMIFSIIPILLYNGEIGKKSSKYFFYLFYPIHIYILYMISYFIQKV